MPRFAAHPTLAANAVTTIGLDGGRGHQVAIANHGTDAVYVTADGATPTVAGDDTYYVAPGATVTLPTGYGAAATVKLVSAGTPQVSVTAV